MIVEGDAYFLKKENKCSKSVDKSVEMWYNNETGSSVIKESDNMRIMNEENLEKLLAFIKQYARDNNGESPGLNTIMSYMNMVKSTAYRYVSLFLHFFQSV